MDLELRRQLFENSKYGQAQKAISQMNEEASQPKRIQLADGRYL